MYSAVGDWFAFVGVIFRLAAAIDELVADAPNRLDRGLCATQAKQVRKVELQAVAMKVGLSEQDLVKELRGGKSLAQVAQAHNVSRSDLKATMRTALKTTLDQAVQAGKLAQPQEDKALAAFDTRADKVIDRVWPAK